MIVSASQIKTFRRCPRLWWFEKVCKVPEDPDSRSRSLVMGSAFHDVVERWLKADDNGLGPDGESVDPFAGLPEFGLDDEEEEKIRRLFGIGVSEGVLLRWPGRQIEETFTIPVIPGVALTGVIDLRRPGEIQDHKTMKNFRYSLNEERLAKDMQMLIYAKATLLLHEPEATEITVRHNQFAFEKGEVRVVQATVSAEEIEEFWQTEVVPTVQDMKVLADSNIPEGEWLKTHAEFPQACSKYGGCRFLFVCSGQEHPTELRKRVEKKMNPEPVVKSSPVGLVLLHGATFLKKGSLPGRQMTVSDAFRLLIEKAGNTLEEYAKKDAFARRDLVKQLVPEFVESLGDCWILVRPGLDPDEKNFVSALAAHASAEVVGYGL